MAQPLYTSVEYAIVGCELGCSFSKAVARVVGLMEAHCYNVLFQDIDDNLAGEG